MNIRSKNTTVLVLISIGGQLCYHGAVKNERCVKLDIFTFYREQIYLVVVGCQIQIHRENCEHLHLFYCPTFSWSVECPGWTYGGPPVSALHFLGPLRTSCHHCVTAESSALVAGQKMGDPRDPLSVSLSLLPINTPNPLTYAVDWVAASTVQIVEKGDSLP